LTYYRFGYYDNAAPTIPDTDGYKFTRVSGWLRNGDEPSIEAVLGAGAITGADGSDGQDGGDGDSTFVAQVFLRKATAPSTPDVDDGEYNFSTSTLTPPTISGGSDEDWFVTPPTTDGNPLYVSVGSFFVNGTTGTDSTVTWTAPAILVEDGIDGADAGFPVVLTQLSVSFSQEEVATYAGIRFNTDGSIDARGWAGGTYIQQNVGEWFTGEPEADYGDDFEVRCEEILSGAWVTSAAPEGTWVPLTSNRLWSVGALAMAAPYYQYTPANFEIRRIGTTGPVASATMSCEAEITEP